MGSTCSHQNCNDICNCFVDDGNISNVEVVRDVKVKWLWTTEHESTLLTILTDKEYDYNVPKVIVNVIKDLSYSKTEKFYISETQICKEKYYKKQQKLLNKHLC
eukprot:345811_1